METLTQGAAGAPGPGLRIAPVTPLPSRLAVGGGTALFVDGRCESLGGRIEHLEVIFEGSTHPVLGWGMPLPEHIEGESYWWAILPIEAIDEPRVAWVELLAGLDDGSTAGGRLGSVELVPELPAPAPPVDERPEVAICMATHEPRLDLFRRQVDSIRAQSHDDWICLISDDASSEDTLAGMRDVLGDDERFRLSAFADRLGFYANFERALSLAPAGARYVALSDQDDEWHADKLERLIAGLEPGARLVYSDMRIVSAEGEVLSDTYWQYRRNNHTDFASLLLANTITGAASLFERSLLDDALPFPPRQGNAYHDHWIAQVALALGPVELCGRAALRLRPARPRRRRPPPREQLRRRRGARVGALARADPAAARQPPAPGLARLLLQPALPGRHGGPGSRAQAR